MFPVAPFQRELENLEWAFRLSSASWDRFRTEARRGIKSNDWPMNQPSRRCDNHNPFKIFNSERLDRLVTRFASFLNQICTWAAFRIATLLNKKNGSSAVCHEFQPLTTLILVTFHWHGIDWKDHAICWADKKGENHKQADVVVQLQAPFRCISLISPLPL